MGFLYGIWGICLRAMLSSDGERTGIRNQIIAFGPALSLDFAWLLSCLWVGL